MPKLSLVVAVFLLVLAVPAGAGAQDNSGLGEYQETPPGTDPEASPPSDPSGTPTDPATTDDSGVAGVPTDTSGSATGSASTGLTERQAAAAGETPGGQLPATGFDETAALAIAGASLLVAGLALRRRVSLG